MVYTETIAHIIQQIIAQNPLVLNLTNHVVMNHTANGLLAIGASPIMSVETDEIEDLVQISSAIVINMGTLDHAFVDRALLAAHTAKKCNKPVIFDPVGAGASKFRQKASEEILKTRAVSLIRGNASEIMALATVGDSMGRGVDSCHEAQDAAMAAKSLAKNHQSAVAISGARDIIIHQKQQAFVDIDVPVMTKITGMGCLSSALCGACIAVGKDDVFSAALAAMLVMSVAGSEAYKKTQNIGLFSPYFMDSLNHISSYIPSYTDKIHVE